MAAISSRVIDGVLAIKDAVHLPVTAQLFWTATQRRTKERLAFLVFVILPLGLGSTVIWLGTAFAAVIATIKAFDLQLALLVFPGEKPRILEILRESNRADEALSICGNDFHEKILSLRALAKTKSHQGHKAEALRLFEEAYNLLLNSPFLPMPPARKVEEKDYERSMDLAEMINDLATVLQEQPEKDKARILSLLEQSIKLGSETVGRHDPRVTLWLINLAIFKQQEMGQLKEAEELFEEVLQIRKRTLGDDDPLVAKWMVEMAYLLLSRPDATEIGARIEQLVQDALAVRKRIYGNDHVDVASSLNDCALMAALTAKDGDDAGLMRARDYGKQSADTYERVLGPSHPTTIKARADWG